MNHEILRALHAIVLASLIAVLSGCSREPALPWTSGMIVGKTLEDTDGRGQASYRFEPDGYVLVSAVTADGQMTAPIFEWRIVKGRLHVEGSGFSEELTLVSGSQTEILAKWKSGQTVRFRVVNDR